MWDVEVGLSVMPQSLGTLNATKTHANGGTFNAAIMVLPRLTFREVGNPGNTRSLDYGQEGFPDLQVNFNGAHWVINLDPGINPPIAAPNDGNFVPGVQEVTEGDPTSQVVVQATGTSTGGGVGHPVTPIPLCPLPQGQTDPCAPFQARDCPALAAGGVCVPTVIQQIPGTPPQVLECGCRETSECHVGFGAAQPVCVNVCPDPTLVCKLFGRDADGDGASDVFSCDCVRKPPPDPHRSVQGTSVTFGTADVPAIPAGFFFAGSPSVSGAVNMQPGPLDTLIQRSSSMVCPLPPPAPCDPIQTELVALDLRSVSPLSVGATQWDVAVGMSVNPQTLGTLNATKTHANGGTFDAEIHVLPKITFTEVGNPANVKSIDYGTAPIAELRINFIGAHWVINVDPGLAISAPNDGDFVPGVQEQTPGDPTSQVVVQATGNSKGGGVSHPVRPVPLCPLLLGAADPCAPFQARDCPELGQGEFCVPTIIQQFPGTPPRVLACGCRADSDCRVDFGTPVPVCVNGCPDPTAEICTKTVNAAFEYTCNCDPVTANCEPTTDGTACKSAQCDPTTDECQKHCANYNEATGLSTVTDCDCRGGNDCHLVTPPAGNVAAGGPNGCIVPDNGGGTVTLPPAGCDYLSPDEVHEIINGLPPDTTIELAAIHKDFICNRQPGAAGVCSFTDLVDCKEVGGSLGGEKECSDSTLELTMTGKCTGDVNPLCTYNRTLSLPVSFETHVGPRTPGNPVQSFDTDMFMLQGQTGIQVGIGDPDFDLLKITAGSGFGMLPSPGHTTLTRLPGGSWAVDSFFDVFYEIEFVGTTTNTASPFFNMPGGSTTGTIRMATTAPFKCEGGCPSTQLVCVPKTKVNSDGTLRVCCDCRPPTPSGDPTGVKKPRAISLSVPGGAATAAAGETTAIRVLLTTLHNVDPAYDNGNNLPIPYTQFEGQAMWAGPPVQYFESNSDPTAFMASKLQCTPYYQDWSAISLLHIVGEAILPSSTFDAEILDASCMGIEDTCTAVSAPLTALTARHGDVYHVPPALKPNFGDINSLVSKYQNKLGAPIKVRARMSTGNPRGLISLSTDVGFADIAADVAAYQGAPYPFKPGKCSGSPTTACKEDAECMSGTGPCILCP